MILVGKGRASEEKGCEYKPDDAVSCSQKERNMEWIQANSGPHVNDVALTGVCAGLRCIEIKAVAGLGFSQTRLMLPMDSVRVAGVLRLRSVEAGDHAVCMDNGDKGYMGFLAFVCLILNKLYG
ncbi:hypothetical protein Tco_0449459 [Tanacetum coccineum]